MSMFHLVRNICRSQSGSLCVSIYVTIQEVNKPGNKTLSGAPVEYNDS